MDSYSKLRGLNFVRIGKIDGYQLNFIKPCHGLSSYLKKNNGFL